MSGHFPGESSPLLALPLDRVEGTGYVKNFSIPLAGVAEIIGPSLKLDHLFLFFRIRRAEKNDPGQLEWESHGIFFHPKKVCLFFLGGKVTNV